MATSFLLKSVHTFCALKAVLRHANQMHTLAIAVYGCGEFLPRPLALVTR